MNPILSILVAVLITILLVLFLGFFGFNLGNSGFIFFIVIVLCGGVASWFSTENKVRYSLYYGIISSVSFLILSYILLKSNDYLSLILILIASVFGGYIAKNEKDNIKNLMNKKFQMDYMGFFISFFKRNKNVLVASVVIFLGSVLVGVIGSLLSSAFYQFMTNLLADDTISSTVRFTPLSLFLHNSTVTLLYFYLGGLVLGIINTTHLISFGIAQGFGLVETPISIYNRLSYGIFEFIGAIIATAAGFKLLSTSINIIKNLLHIEGNKPKIRQISQILDTNYMKFRDSLILFSISIIVIFIAAIIEFYILQ